MANIAKNIVRKINERYTLNKKRELDSIYDSIFDNFIGGSVLIPVPQFSGNFYIDSRSHIFRRIIRYKSYEPELVQSVREHLNPEKDVIDVGANIGLFTVLFTKLISKNKRVLSVEPTPGTFTNLSQNIEQNNVQSSVILFNGIATDKEGNYYISIIPGKEEYSTVADKPSHPVVNKLEFIKKEVVGNTIDNLVGNNKFEPGFMKIDVEGFEYSVLKGASETIKKYRPIILMELSNTLLNNCGHTSEEVVLFLEQNNYKVLDHTTKSRPTTPFIGDVIAIPQ